MERVTLQYVPLEIISSTAVGEWGDLQTQLCRKELGE